MTEFQAEMDRIGADQILETDSDARSMAITSRHPRIIGYNVQSAVNTEHHLIVAHEVTNIGVRPQCLSDMANQARDALGVEKLDAVADKGEEIVACEDDDITVTPPKIATLNAKAHGRFDRSAFIFDAEKSIYICPASAGQHLDCHTTCEEGGKVLHAYWTNVCQPALSGQAPRHTRKRASPLVVGTQRCPGASSDSKTTRTRWRRAGRLPSTPSAR